MGIQGLSTYIARNSDQYLESYNLHNSYLVIDGNSLACQLYNRLTHCNCAFGGDYDKFAQRVGDFFDGLLKCKVTPLVLIDGGYENKKIKTTYSRLKSKIQLASYFNPSQTVKFFPLLMKEVFKDVLNEKNIMYAQCFFEADDDIAAVARILRCPVLSYDSDFFVYNVLYIPFNTLESGISKNSVGYIKRCKIYRVEKFLSSFGGLDRTLLPLLATLLGNDYIKRRVFNKFFQNLKLSKLTKKHHNEQQRRITALLNWLRPHNLNSAIAGVLFRIRKEDRPKVLKKIEAIIEGYTNCSPHMLTALGFSEQYIADLKIDHPNHCFKFQGDLNSLGTSVEMTTKNSNDSETSDEEDDEDEISDENDDLNLSAKNILSRIAPSWFIEEFSKGKFPSYFIDMIYRQLYFCPPQIEDYFYPAAHLISLKIIAVIFQLLTSTNPKEERVLEYVLRDENNRVTRNRLEDFPQNLPLITNLNELPVAVKLGIMLKTLNFNIEENLDKILPEWKLYLGTIIYWVRQQHAPSVTNCHIWALLCAMLFGIIDKKIGFYRTKHAFANECKEKTVSVIEVGTNSLNVNQDAGDTCMKDAYDAITKNDCTAAAPFFISNFIPNPKTIHNPKVFNVTIVHSFAQFQSCLRHSMNLNALLGYPYLQPKVAELYNGTLLYNLYQNFKKRNDIEAYLKVVLKDSPNLLQILTIVSIFVKDSLGNLCDNTTNSRRKRKNRNKVKKTSADECMSSESDDERADKSYRFSDPNNPFDILDLLE